VKKFGKYTVKGLLGRGGMGAVYRAAIPNTEKIVALKVCEPRQVLVNILGMEEVRRQFMKEAVTMARLRHPNIAEVWDLETHNGRPFFVMEYYCNNLGVLTLSTTILALLTAFLPAGRSYDWLSFQIVGLFVITAGAGLAFCWWPAAP